MVLILYQFNLQVQNIDSDPAFQARIRHPWGQSYVIPLVCDLNWSHLAGAQAVRWLELKRGARMNKLLIGGALLVVAGAGYYFTLSDSEKPSAPVEVVTAPAVENEEVIEPVVEAVIEGAEEAEDSVNASAESVQEPLEAVSEGALNNAVSAIAAGEDATEALSTAATTIVDQIQEAAGAAVEDCSSTSDNRNSH